MIQILIAHGTVLEELIVVPTRSFLAIAALRDDSNYMQWFIADSILSVSYDDSIGNDHYFTEPKGIMFFWDENWNHETIISGRYHKATVNELIEHFNKS
jgi:hypothetical protein